MEEFFRYIRNLSPVKFFTTSIVCGVAASEFVLAASEFTFFAGSVSGWCYLFVGSVSRRYGPNYIRILPFSFEWFRPIQRNIYIYTRYIRWTQNHQNWSFGQCDADNALHKEFICWEGHCFYFCPFARHCMPCALLSSALCVAAPVVEGHECSTINEADFGAHQSKRKQNRVLVT